MFGNLEKYDYENPPLQKVIIDDVQKALGLKYGKYHEPSRDAKVITRIIEFESMKHSKGRGRKALPEGYPSTLANLSNDGEHVAYRSSPQIPPSP